MVDKAPLAASDDEGGAPSDAGAPADGVESTETPAAERGDVESKTARRRARLQEEIRAGVQRALKH